MDRLTQLRGEAGCSRDSSLDSSALSEAYITANESSKYFSLSDDVSSFEMSQDDLTSTLEAEKTITGNDQLISNLSPNAKKSDLTGSYKFGNQIEAANILSGGVDIFDDNDNSYDGDELVIDDNAEVDEKLNTEPKLIDNSELPFPKAEETTESLDTEPAIGSKDTEVVLQIDGKNVNAIDIGNGLYLYRKAGEEELAAVQIVADDNDQPSFKFLKVRENVEGNLEVYEEIEIEVPKDMPTKDEKNDKNTSQVPVKDVNKAASGPISSKLAETKKPQQELSPIPSTSNNDDLNKPVSSEPKPEAKNGKMMKLNETRKSPVIHSTPNKEGIPLTKTMVDLHLHPSRPLDKVKTIEVHTDNIKQKIIETHLKNKDLVDYNKSESIINTRKVEEPVEKSETDSENKSENDTTSIAADESEKETENQNEIEIQAKQSSNDVMPKEVLKDDKKPDTKRPEKEELSDTNDKLRVGMEQKADTPKSEENFNIIKVIEELDSIDVPKGGIKSKPATLDISKAESPNKQPDQPESQQNITENVSLKINDNFIQVNLNNELKPIMADKQLKTPVETKTQEVLEIAEENTDKRVNAIEISTSNKINESKVSKRETINKTTVNTAESPQMLNISTGNTEQKNKFDTNIKPKASESSFPTISDEQDASQGNIVIENKKPSQPNETNTKPIIETKKVEQNSVTSQGAKTDTKDDSKTEAKQLHSGEATQSNILIVKENPVYAMKQLQENKTAAILNKPTETNPISKPINEKDYKEDTKRPENLKHQSLVKPELKTKLPTIMPMVPPKRPNAYSRVSVSSMDKKPIILNNNAAVPFGQWTPANRQEFLNKIKESRIPTNASNTKSISKPNDLNRRDVLQKIDSQRQSSNASKNQELAKLNIKSETPSFTNKSAMSNPHAPNPDPKSTVKVEAQALKSKPDLPQKVEKPNSSQMYRRTQDNSTVTSTNVAMIVTSTPVAKSEVPHRNEFNQQDLIDKTVEGIINRVITQKEPLKSQSSKPRESKPSILDDIEMKMNELHGIPFVERPPHELPKVYNRDIKTYAKVDNTKLSTNKVNKIPNLLPVTKSHSKDVKESVIDLDSEEEVIEHEPITGDIDFYKKNTASKHSSTSVDTTMAQVGSDTSKKESIITEKDFDKFVRRNSVTYENCLTVNVEQNKNHNVIVQSLSADMNKKSETSAEKVSSSSQISAHQNKHPNKIHVAPKVPANEDTFNKHFPSKLQMAYQTALTTKRQMESPITILEDKPVKVVFMDSNTDFQTSPLNVQGPGLSPSKKLFMPKELDAVTVSTGDSLDSDILDSIDDVKTQEEMRGNKTKHQRKQILTPADETPELELIVPKDLGIEVSPKKKRKTDDIRTDKISKNLVPKKSYLLGRNTDSCNPDAKDSAKELPKQINDTNNSVVSHNNTASAIDNLVKAAELIENQFGNFETNTDVSTEDGASSTTPVKRGRGRPRKYPLPEGTPDRSKAPSPQKKPRLIDAKHKSQVSATDDDSSDGSAERIVRENWTMGKINENIVCPICGKLFRSENVVFKHVKHCTGPSPSRSDSQRLSNDSKSMESKFDDTDGDTDSGVSKQSTPKKQKPKDSSGDAKEDVIEETPVTSQVEKIDEPKQHESRKPTKTKAQYKVSSLSCEYCGKNFRQLSYLVSHKLLHTKANIKNLGNENQNSNKSVFSCETCKKVFRKLHHLVQHRIIHNPSSMPKLTRKSSSEQNAENKVTKERDIKQTEDQSAAFRCEPCDKSFRKLHHLVEHRETHDGINRQKNAPTPQSSEKLIQNPLPPPQCDICKKTFRKLHHLIEHKEQHLETGSEKSDDKSVKSSLSTKDIIHECSLCYMVFPNEHSLNKHSVFCQKKKRQPANKKQEDETLASENIEVVDVKEINTTVAPAPEPHNIEEAKTTEAIVEVSKAIDIETVKEVPEILEKKASSKAEPEELPIEPIKSRLEKVDSSTNELVEDISETSQNLKKLEEKSEDERKKTIDVTKKKTPVKTVTSASKRRKSNLALARVKEAKELESSDEDEVRYMFNPDFKDSKDSSIKLDVSDSTSKGKLFLTISSQRRNSLQFESSSPRELLKRRTSYQLPPKIPRLKTKQTETNVNNNTPVNIPTVITKPPKLKSVPSSDSEDSDVKYSFPEHIQKPVGSEKSPKQKRKSITGKRKTLCGIPRRKSSGNPAPGKQMEKNPPVKEVKRPRNVVEYRCDCGQLFSSAALLARHTSLAHTPPRVRRRREPSPPPAPVPPPAPSPAPARKPDNVAPAKLKPGRPPGKSPGRKSKAESIPAPTGLQSRKSAAQRSVPVEPGKVKRLKK